MQQRKTSPVTWVMADLPPSGPWCLHRPSYQSSINKHISPSQQSHLCALVWSKGEESCVRSQHGLRFCSHAAPLSAVHCGVAEIILNYCTLLEPHDCKVRSITMINSRGGPRSLNPYVWMNRNAANSSCAGKNAAISVTGTEPGPWQGGGPSSAQLNFCCHPNTLASQANASIPGVTQTGLCGLRLIVLTIKLKHCFQVK